MGKIRRIISLTLCLALTVSSLSGCGGNDKNQSESSDELDISVSIIDKETEANEDMSEIEYVEILQVNRRLLPESIVVYNFTVADNHTYFVGESGMLVHNKCNSALKNARNNGVKRAWEKEVRAVKEGNSKYNWTRKEIKELYHFPKA